MKKIYLIAIFLIDLILTGAGRTQPSGVLIGLRHDITLSQPLPYGETADANRIANYRTIWISICNDDSISIVEIQDIIVPRDNSFWKIQVLRQSSYNWVEDFIIACPIGDKPQIPVLDSTMVGNCEGNHRLSLIFVGSSFLSYEGGSDGYCVGAAHPWHVHYLKTIPLDDRLSDGINISTPFGSEARSALLSGARQYLLNKNSDRLNSIPDEKNWGIIRRRGNWILRGQLDYSSEVFRGVFAHFDIPFQPPTDFTGIDHFGLTWQQIKGMVPQARDALTSPDKKYLILLTSNNLQIYSIANSQLIQKIPLFPDEFLIIAHWSPENQLQKWDHFIKNL